MAAKKIFLCLHIFIVVMILLEFGRLADVVTHGGTIQDWISQRGDSFSQNYFNAYPNNIFLTIIFAGIKYLSSLFGCVDNYFPTIVAGVISTDAAIVFTVMTVWKLTQSRKVTFLSIIICTVFLGFNPWIIIPYSDTYVLPFLSAILYFYYAQDNKMIYNILQSIWVSIQILVCSVLYYSGYAWPFLYAGKSQDHKR